MIEGMVVFMAYENQRKKISLLRKHFEMACHNLFCCSANLGMTIPKEGYEKEWQEYFDECRLLEEMIRECAAGGGGL